MTDDTAPAGLSPVRSGKAGSKVVALVGFMGAGKTTVGQVLAARLAARFLDLDDLVQARDGRTIAQIFHQDGEAAFRSLEQKLLREIAVNPHSEPTVLSLGGGAFIDNTNQVLLRENGIQTVFLDAPAEELFRRCAQPGVVRPLLHESDRFEALYEARRPEYLRAGICVQTGQRDIASIVEEIISRLGLA